MKRIYITAFTSMNFGDDLFVKVLCERYPMHQFYIDCDEALDNAFQTIQNLTILNRGNSKGKWMKRFQRYGRKAGLHIDFAYDAQVYIGGSIFIEFKNDLQYHGYFKNLYSTKLISDIPYFIIGANFGPYNTLDFVEKHKEYFRYQVNDICMRDINSYELFKDIPHVRYAPDTLLNTKLPVIPKKNLILISCIYNDGRDDLINFSNEHYEKKIISLCEYYLSMGKQVCLLSFCSLQGDFVTCRNVQTHLNGAVDVVEYTGNLDEVLTLFASAEYVIASRFHAMILGWLAQIPVFPVSYNNKTKNALSAYNFKGNYTMIDEFCQLSCSQIDKNRTDGYIFDIEHLKADASKQFQALEKFLNI